MYKSRPNPCAPCDWTKGFVQFPNFKTIYTFLFGLLTTTPFSTKKKPCNLKQTRMQTPTKIYQLIARLSSSPFFHTEVDAVIVLCAFPRMITMTVTSSWYFLLLPTGILINSSAVKAGKIERKRLGVAELALMQVDLKWFQRCWLHWGKKIQNYIKQILMLLI